jgi:hypothetical protein
MELPAPSPAPRRETAVRIGLAAAGIVLALIALGRYWTLREALGETVAWIERDGAPVEARLERELAREPEVEGLAVRGVRAALAREVAAAATLDPSLPQGREEIRASTERLEETARRAAAVLAARPASWEAAMVLGAATYLSRSQARDPRLFTEHEAWEEPLEAAHRLAPAKPEPVRFLTAAYLEIWPALSEPKRETTRHLLAEMLRNPEDAGVLLGPWLNIAGSKREALSVLPPEPQVWERVQSLFAERGDWEGFVEVRAQWDHVLRSRLRRDLTEADALLARGATSEARSLCVSVLQQARPDPSYGNLLETALTECPPGPVGRETAAKLRRQLDHALERCLLAHCDLAPAALQRLAHLAGDQAPSQEALAVLLSGDLPGALALDRNAEAQWSEAWAPYLIAKARTLTARQQLADAAAALDFVPNSWWEQPAYWQARLELAQASGDEAAAGRAAERLRQMTREVWPATDWTWRQDRARLAMLTGVPAEGVEVDLAGVPAGGAVVELRMDGALLGTFPARPGTVLRLDAPLRPGLHLLGLESVGGGRVLPGSVRLR